MSNYLVIGTAERGYSTTILKILAQVAKFTEAQAVYTGALSDIHAMRMYHSASGRVRTLEQKSVDKRTKAQNRSHKAASKSVRQLVKQQDAIIEALEEQFGDVQYVTNDELFIPEGLIEQREHTSHLDLSKYITITPVAPNGNRVSGNPITPRSIQMYRFFNNSVVAPHPVVATRLFAKEGINQALQFMTTGALREPHNAKRQSETYEHFSQPGALLITLDDDNGKFYHQRLTFDKMTNGQTVLLWDGLIFTSTGWKEAPRQDRMTGLTDSHGDYKDRACWEGHKELAKAMQPGLIVHNGDLMDCESLNPHADMSTLAHDGLRLKDDIEQMFADIDDLDNLEADNIVITESNHHDWITRYVNKHKVLQGLFDLPTLNATLEDHIWLRWDQPGQESYMFGDYYIRHGHTDGSVIGLSKSHDKAINGHYHSHEEFMNAIRIGCSCRYPPYMRGQSDKWILQIYSGTKHRGKARIHAKTVLKHGKTASFCYRGEIIEFAYTP